MIIPVASICTDGYALLRQLLSQQGDLVVSSFNDRPGRLFDGLEHIRLSIILFQKTRAQAHTISTTKYNKWQTIERPTLFQRLAYEDITGSFREGTLVVKFGAARERSILQKVVLQEKTLAFYSQKAGAASIFYTRKLSGFVQILDFVPALFDAQGMEREPSELKRIAFASTQLRDIFLALLNSNLFYWLLTIYSDCRNLNKREVYAVPFDVEQASPGTVKQLSTFSRQLMEDFRVHAKLLEMNYEGLGKMTIQCIYPKLSKPIIDEIDRVLAQHYSFTDEELDFIINYDIKYRMGRDSGDESEE